MLSRELYFAMLGTGATCLATVLGAGTVFLFKKDMSAGLQRAFLGFAAGVMIAASVWSLLIPAMEMAEEQGPSALLAAGGGFVLGGVFLMLLDRLLPHLPTAYKIGICFPYQLVNDIPTDAHDIRMDEIITL